jgi:hypothetical protein
MEHMIRSYASFHQGGDLAILNRAHRGKHLPSVRPTLMLSARRDTPPSRGEGHAFWALLPI